MNRQEIMRFYENKIDDVKDGTKRDELFEKLEELDDLMLELDSDIGKEIEEQDIEYIDNYALEDEFNYANRMPM